MRCSTLSLASSVLFNYFHNVPAKVSILSCRMELESPTSLHHHLLHLAWALYFLPRPHQGLLILPPPLKPFATQQLKSLYSFNHITSLLKNLQQFLSSLEYNSNFSPGSNCSAQSYHGQFLWPHIKIPKACSMVLPVLILSHLVHYMGSFCLRIFPQLFSIVLFDSFMVHGSLLFSCWVLAPILSQKPLLNHAN